MAEEPLPPPQPTQAASPNVEIDWDTEPNPLYANIFVMSATMPDIFSLVFADASMLRPTTDDGVMLANVTASLRIPASSMEEFIGAIVSAWNEYVDRNPSRGLRRYREE